MTPADERDNYNTLKRFMTRIVDLVQISTSQTSGVRRDMSNENKMLDAYDSMYMCHGLGLGDFIPRSLTLME